MPSHGDFDPDLKKWFCGFWMNEVEWDGIHDYRPDEPDTVDEAIDEAGSD